MLTERMTPIYTFPIDLDIHHIPARKDEAEHFHFDIRYALLTKTPQNAMLSTESTGLTWLDQNTIQNWMDSAESISRAVKVATAELKSK